MKIIAVGDIHGRTNWEQIVKQHPEFDKFVFIGDYFDPYDDIPATKQIENFNNIIAFKAANKDKVIMLIGNHDYHYMKDVDENYSRFNYHNAAAISNEFTRHNELLQLCCIIDKYLFVHAGVTKYWCYANNINIDCNLEYQLNNLFTTNKRAFRFTPGEYFSMTGDEICQSPIWVRPQSLMADAIDNYTQIVGHTQVKEINVNNPFCNAIFIDALNYNQYLVIEDDNPKVGYI